MTPDDLAWLGFGLLLGSCIRWSWSNGEDVRSRAEAVARIRIEESRRMTPGPDLALAAKIRDAR